MGAWGNGPFENDLAADLLADWTDAPDATDLLSASLRRACEQPGYLEEPDASGAVAAAACAVALLTEAPQFDALRDDVADVRLNDGRSAELLSLSARALERILAPDSELLELWDDAGDAEAFRAQLLELRAACTR